MSELVTPYAAAKIVNEILTEVGIKNIPPQMVYNYVGKGYIASTEIAGKKKVSIEDLQVWIEKYLAKKGIVIEKTEEVSEEEQAELDEDAKILSELES